MVLKILLFPIMLIIVLYVLIVQVMPTYDAIGAEKIQISQKETDLENAQARKAKMEGFIQSVQAHPKEKEFATTFVPVDQQEEVLINDIAQLAQKTNVNLFSIGFADEGVSIAVKDVRLIEGRLIVSGSYQNIKAFTNQLFHLKRIYAFKSIDLVKPELDSEEQQGDLILSGTVNFSYGYTSGDAGLGVVDFGKDVDYELLETIMNSSVKTDPLVSEPKSRVNPFLP